MVGDTPADLKCAGMPAACRFCSAMRETCRRLCAEFPLRARPVLSDDADCTLSSRHCFDPSAPIFVNRLAGISRQRDRWPSGRSPAQQEAKNMERKNTERSGRLPEPRAQEQDAGHDLPGERRQTAGDRHLVRQLLRAAAPRRPFAARLQARDLDHHAGAAGPALRRRPEGESSEPDRDATDRYAPADAASDRPRPGRSSGR